MSGTEGGDSLVESFWNIPECKYSCVGCFPDVQIETQKELRSHQTQSLWPHPKLVSFVSISHSILPPAGQITTCQAPSLTLPNWKDISIKQLPQGLQTQMSPGSRHLQCACHGRWAGTAPLIQLRPDGSRYPEMSHPISQEGLQKPHFQKSPKV